MTIDERADEPLKANDQRTALARMRLLCNALKAKLTPLDKRSGMCSPNQPSPGTQINVRVRWRVRFHVRCVCARVLRV